MRGAADRANARVTLLGIQEANLTRAEVLRRQRLERRREGQPEPRARPPGARREEGDKPRTVFTRTHAAAEVAKPLYYRGQANWVVLYSRPFDDVADAVKLVRKRLLQASALALRGHAARRLLSPRAWSAAACASSSAPPARSPRGDFVEPIQVDSNDELGSLAVAFNEMQERLKQVDRARREFIANASHELRTPIFSLGGFVELLQDEELDETTRAEFLATMHEQVDRLQKLAVDLLDLSRMDAGSLRLEDDDVDLGQPRDARSPPSSARPRHATARRSS